MKTNQANKINYLSNSILKDRFKIREKVQVKLLEIISNSKYADKLAFIGGNCLRIVYNNHRFSEDLDFDNMSLVDADFDDVINIIQYQFESDNIRFEVRFVAPGTYHIRLPDYLYLSGDGYHAETFLLQLDAESKHFNYRPQQVFVNVNGNNLKLYTAPLDILLSQKIKAILCREKNKGGDFYDLLFLLKFAKKPNYDYLEDTIKVRDPEKIKQLVIEKCNSLNLPALADHVEPFLLHQLDKYIVSQFIDIFQSAYTW